jgi:intracellular septation protein
MKFLFDVFPVLVFFIVYKLGEVFPVPANAFAQHYMLGLVSGGHLAADQAPMMVATLVAIIVSVLQVGLVLVKGHQVDMMLWVGVAVIVVFGSATIYLHDSTFIKWKPTIINWAYALGIGVAQLGFGRNIIREMMKDALVLPDPVWYRLGLMWMGFFTVLGAVNLLAAFVIFRGNESAWVSFKAFGLPGLTFVFAIVQSLFVARHLPEEA